MLKESVGTYYSQSSAPENAFTVFIGISASEDLKKIVMLMLAIFVDPRL